MQPYSVVIPAMNAQATLRETLDSLGAQTVPPAEIVVVDDGSTDDTAAIAAAWGASVKVVPQANAGPGAATNAGVAVCSCPILAFVDADDLWLPGKMEMQLEALAQPGPERILGGWMRHFRGRDDGSGRVQDGMSRSTMALRAETFLKVGDIVDPPGLRGDLVDWLGRARHAGIDLMVLPEVLALRRIQPGSLSYGRDPQRDKGYLLAAREALLRNRAMRSRS